MNSNALRDLLAQPEQESVATSISERLSQELVIALVGPVGSGVSTAAGYIRDILEQDFGYNVCPIIKPSNIIRAEAHRVGITNIRESPIDLYISDMQTAGNRLREKFGGNYLAEKTVERIYKFRKDKGGITENGVPLPGRRAYIIDSLKNTEELALLRQIYGETLCVFGIFAPDSIRSTRLQNNGAQDTSITKIMDRDRSEIQTFGQKTKKLFVSADFFVCNDNKVEELRRKIFRFLNITFNTTIHTPTRDESAMYEASSVAAKSACMSRQVGAVIVSKGGELISVGWNDVPRFGGGLYTEDDQFIWDPDKKALTDNDHRCFKWKKCICHNETRRVSIIDKISGQISAAGLLKKGISKDDVRSLLKGTEIDSLIEFSRSIHAEMEAILSVAREGRHSLSGATLYTNTYPCHNCARHIVAAGISTVIYVEPYDKSLAIALHNDSVTETPDDRTRVVFRQYDGVAPRNYLRLFRPTADRKMDGKLVQPSRKEALPMFRIPLDSPADYEAKIIADLSDKEQT
jgi:deoxycytidylate deaminase